MHSSWIKELTTNNHAPSDEATLEVKRVLVTPLQDLQNVDSEILDLKSRLSDLENKRNEMQKSLTPYTSILSPIRRMPPDVLGEIFWHCLPTHRNPTMKATECPMLLTRICSTWRAAAMADPRLWAQIYITFTDDDTVPDAEDVAAERARDEDNAALPSSWSLAVSKSEKEQATETLRMKLNAVKEWFSRSGTMPLSISLCFTENFWYSIPYSERPQPNVTMEFLAFLASLSPRLEDLELKMSIELYRVLEEMMSVSEMKMLSSLRVEYYCQIPQAVEDRSRPILLFGAKNLRKVSMLACDPRLWGIVNGPSPYFGWSAFTDVSCHSSITIFETKLILEQCSNLIHLKALISDNIADHDGPPASYQGHRITLPFLRTLRIVDYNNPRNLGNLYGSIDAPGLKWVWYNNYYHPNVFSVDRNSATPIIPLLQNSTALKKLSFDGADIADLDISRILLAVPTITHLVLGPEHRSTTGKPNLFRNGPHPSGPRYLGNPSQSSWNINDLVAGASSEVQESEINIPVQSGLKGKGSPPLTLLPRLESLEVSSPNIVISDDVLVEFVKSRLPPHATEDIATLKHVGIMFYRQQTRNATEEIMQYAELAGVKINLELDYAEPFAPEQKATSPEFGLGLRDSSGRSWSHQDAGEYEEWYR